jgi:virulence factor Mce-like protein
MRRVLRPLASGLIAAMFLAGAVLAYFQLRSDDDTYQVTAYFEKAIGLFENSDVTILGVEVGKITAVEPVGQRVKVVMNISGDYKIPRDATAQVIPISVISDRYVQFSPVYQGGPALQDGAVLDTDSTQIPAELDDVFKQLMKLLEAIEPGKTGDPGALGDLVVALNEALENRESDLRGTLINTADLTHTLARAEEDLSGILVNLDRLFARLATRTGTIGELNRNMALVFTALAESRSDLEGTVAGLADLTNEVGDLMRDHGDRLGQDVRLAARITSAVIENRLSVEESLAWLPVVGEGLANAYHGGHVNATDVRDNVQARLECEIFEDILDQIPDDTPLDPLDDALKRLKRRLKRFVEEECTGETGEPSGGGAQATAPVETPGPAPVPISPPELPDLDLRLDCDRGVRKVKRQIRRIESTGLPRGVQDEVVKPLKQQLRELARKCEKVGNAIEKDLLEDLLRNPPTTDDLPDVDTQDAVDDLTGSASGTSASGPAPAESNSSSFFSGFLSFLGWSR